MRSRRPASIVLAVALVAGCLVAGWFVWRSVQARTEVPREDDTVGTAAFDPPVTRATPPPALSGIILDEGGQGIAGATVEAICGDRDPVATATRLGAFTFADLPAGECEVAATAPGHVAAGPAPAARATVRIRAGTPLAGLELQLYREAVVSGQVRAGDQPVEEATLSVLYLEAPNAEGPFSISVDTRSGAGGAYRIERLGPGRVQVLAEHERWGLAESEERFLQPGERVEGLDIALQDTGTLRGVALDTRGRPIAGAEVAVAREGSVRREQAVTGEDGVFVLPAVPAGAVTVTALAHGLEPGRQEGVEIRPGEETEVTLELTARPGFGGIVLTPAGEPASRAAVYVRPVGTERPDGGTPAAVTDESGRFWIEEPPPPPSVAWARHRELAPSPDEPIGGSERDLTLTLQEGGRLVGQVVDGEGEPIAVFTVTARQSFQGGHSEQVRDPSGRFAISAEPGRYALVVSSPGKPDVETSRLLVQSGRDTDVGRIVMGEGGAVVGQAVAAETGEPLSGIQVRADSVRRGRSVTTGPDGRFRLEGLPAGTTSLALTGRGRLQRLIPSVGVADGETLDAGDIPLRRGRSGRMQYSGVGISIRFEDDRIVLNEAFEGGPAARAGLTEGTAILAVNGQPIAELTPNQVVQLIRGESGSDVTLDVLLPDASYAETMRIERGEVIAPRQ